MSHQHNSEHNHNIKTATKLLKYTIHLK